jgi:hypothetical protein
MPITQDPTSDHPAVGLSERIFMFKDEVIRSRLRLEGDKIVRMNSDVMSQAFEDCCGVHSALAVVRSTWMKSEVLHL